MNNPNKTIALIVAAGRGTRFNSSLPKQYHLINNKPILRLTIEKFLNHPLIDDILVVINQDDEKLYKEATKGLELLPFVYGKKERSGSVKEGLNALKKYKPDYVLIHDAMRLFIAEEIITEVIAELKNYDAVIPIIEITDTVKFIKNDLSTLNRNELKLAQTPQGFIYQKILSEYNNLNNHYTDDVSLLENKNYQIKTIKGLENNFKITTLEDYKRAKMMLSKDYQTRVGFGFDVHAFAEEKGDNFIILGGIKIPHDYQIKAHSDGDVLIHALTDAMLGAIGKGDIGEYFPPNDNKWLKADSKIFLDEAMSIINSSNSYIVNIDITIICEVPKINPYKQLIKQQLANYLMIDQEKINIKATTTEKLGFIGREEGIAVNALVNINKLVDILTFI